MKLMQPSEVFIITPFDPDGRRVQDTIKQAIEEAGFKVLPNVGDIRPGAELASKIIDQIRKADVIIANLSGSNPNVFYEIGFAHALRKPTILLVDLKSGSSLPSDLAGLEFVSYDPSNFRRLVDQLRTLVRRPNDGAWILPPPATPSPAKPGA